MTAGQARLADMLSRPAGLRPAAWQEAVDVPQFGRVSVEDGIPTVVDRSALTGPPAVVAYPRASRIHSSSRRATSLLSPRDVDSATGGNEQRLKPVFFIRLPPERHLHDQRALYLVHLRRPNTLTHASLPRRRPVRLLLPDI